VRGAAPWEKAVVLAQVYDPQIAGGDEVRAGIALTIEGLGYGFAGLVIAALLAGGTRALVGAPAGVASTPRVESETNQNLKRTVTIRGTASHSPSRAGLAGKRLLEFRHVGGHALMRYLPGEMRIGLRQLARSLGPHAFAGPLREADEETLVGRHASWSFSCWPCAAIFHAPAFQAM